MNTGSPLLAIVSMSEYSLVVDVVVVVVFVFVDVVVLCCEVLRQSKCFI